MRRVAPCFNAALTALLLLLACLLPGCQGGDPLPRQVLLGGLDMRIWKDPARIEILAPDGRVLLSGLPGGSVATNAPAHVALAVRRAEPRIEMQFGSFKIEEEADPWQGVARFGEPVVEEETVSFELIDSLGRPVGEGRVSEAGPDHMRIVIEASDPEINRISMAFRCGPGDHFMGLGGQSFDVDHRGQTVPLWVQEDGITKLDTDDYGDGLWFLQGRRHSTHTPMPIYLSNRGYMMLVDTPARSSFSFCSEAEDVLRIEAWEGRLDMHLFYGPEPLKAIEGLTAHLGRPELPPAFAFAPWLDAIYGSENVRRVAAKLREEGVPSSVIWTEDWRGGSVDSLGYTLEEDWNLDRGLYPDFEELAGELHDLGFKFLTYNNTFIGEGVDVYEEAVLNGYTIKNQDGAPYLFTNGSFGKASLLDLTNPEAWAWAKEVYRTGLLQGADGYMADFAEWMPADAVLFSGEDAMLHHNLYPVAYHRFNKEIMDEMYELDGVERLFFVRSAYLGSQPLVSVVWAGDQQTDFSEGDGLPSVIPMGIGLGVAGFPYFGHDIAGYASHLTVPVSRELFFRWVTFGALSPVMRTHHGKIPADNWSWESDAASTAHLGRWAAFHMRLFPYLYGLARQAADTGAPMMRAMALHYPDFEPMWYIKDQYMLGDRLIVAPVVVEGQISRTVVLPAGTFFPLWGGPPETMPQGGGSVVVDAPLSEIPVFVPAGALLVLLSEAVDTVVDADPESGATTLSDLGGDREVWVWPGGWSRFTEASGSSYEWQAQDMEGSLTVETPVTWNGQAVYVQQDNDTIFVEVEGNGVLAVAGDATLNALGASSSRRLRVRFR